MANLSNVLGALMASGMGGRSTSGPNFAAAAPQLVGTGGSAQKAGMSLGQKAGLAALGYLAYKAYQNYQSPDDPTSPSAEPAKKGVSGPFGSLFDALGIFGAKDETPAAAGSAGTFGNRLSDSFKNTPSGQEPALDDRKALLLIRAMIAAANADGEISAPERDSILKRVDQSGAGPEERRIVEQELQSPRSLDALLREVPDPETGEQVYLASKMAVSGGRAVDQNYLNYLASRLNLPENRRRELDEIT
jgi:uncharacterized membrane protein YebE (DUF533 family)